MDAMNLSVRSQLETRRYDLTLSLSNTDTYLRGETFQDSYIYIHLLAGSRRAVSLISPTKNASSGMKIEGENGTSIWRVAAAMRQFWFGGYTVIVRMEEIEPHFVLVSLDVIHPAADPLDSLRNSLLVTRSLGVIHY